MICQKQHRYNPIFEKLGPSQASDGRHICVGCAYEAGFADGFNNVPPDFVAASGRLNKSQAGTGRHRDAGEAYRIGYQEGAKRRY